MKKTIFFLICGILFFVLSIYFFSGDLERLLMVISFIIAFFPIVIEKNIYLRKEREKEERFLEFLRDIIEGVKSGTPINKTILNMDRKDYGVLTIYIKKLIGQISLGIPLNEALVTFAKETNCESIKRTTELISEAHKSGGEILEVLDSAANSLNQMQNIKKERRAAISSIIIQGYIIFFVFVAIILVLQFLLFPMIKNVGVKEKSLEINPMNDFDFSKVGIWLLVIQAFFAGLVIGSISEGKILAGIKHSFLLISISLLIYSIVSLIV